MSWFEASVELLLVVQSAREQVLTPLCISFTDFLTTILAMDMARSLIGWTIERRRVESPIA
jgi:hypothetical protein